jgi:hypothetical protein
MMFQPCFLAVEKKERMSAKSIAPCNDRKPPEIFLTKLHHARVAFGLIVGEGNSRIVKDAQCVLFARCEAQEEIVSGSARRTAPPFAASLDRGAHQRLWPHQKSAVALRRGDRLFASQMDSQHSDSDAHVARPQGSHPGKKLKAISTASSTWSTNGQRRSPAASGCGLRRTVTCSSMTTSTSHRSSFGLIEDRP